MNLKKYRIYIIFALVILIGILGYFFIFKKDSSQITPQFTTVKKGEVINTVTATGTVQPTDKVDVGTQVSGVIEKIYADYNSSVKKGQLLAVLDKTNLQATLNVAQANYSAALNELNYYQQNYTRQLNMYNAKVISKSELEQASYQLNNAKMSVKQNQSSVVQAKTNLSYAYIYSPIDGVVLTKEVEEGQTVAASMSTPTLFTIARDLTKMKVEANVDEADIGNVQNGQKVTFTVDAYPEKTFNGKVTQVRLGTTTTSNVVTYTVVIEANNDEKLLKPGLTATIAIYTKELRNITVVEAKAFSFTPDESTLKKYYEQQNIPYQKTEIKKGNSTNKYVWIIDKDEKLKQKNVVIGDGDGINIQIISGLNVGDKVVYDLSETDVTTTTNSESSDSPFMPKRPGSNKKTSSSSSSKTSENKKSSGGGPGGGPM